MGFFKSAVLVKQNKPLKIFDIKIPEPVFGQVLVKILYSGFCSSQFGEIKGVKGKDNYLPHLLGHEACGIVLKVGSDVKKVKRNDLFVLHWMKSKGKESQKIKYISKNGLKINSGKVTTFSNLSLVSENRITKINYPSGDVIWNLGYELGSGDIDCGQDLGFSFQHSIQKLDNGNILTFDNGNLSEIFLNQDNKTSRSIEIDVIETENGCEAQLAWEYILPENLYGYLSGNTQKLDNGNYLSTTIGGGGTSLEVNQNGDQVWEANYNLQIPDGLVYRAMRIPGIFPIEYSVTFPQMNDQLYQINLDDEDDFKLNILNNGDYSQQFLIELNIINNNSENYDLEIKIIPEHHPEESKTYDISLYNSAFTLENNVSYFSLEPNQETVLSFGGNILNNDNLINNYFKLEEPYPNPFNPSVNFDIHMLSTQNVNINIYDIYGNNVENVYNGILNNGLHKFRWKANNYSTGIYIIECKTKTAVSTEKVYLIK